MTVVVSVKNSTAVKIVLYKTEDMSRTPRGRVVSVTHSEDGFCIELGIQVRVNIVGINGKLLQL